MNTRAGLVAELRPLLIEHDIQVVTYEIDFAGHVSNIAYLRWLEDMRFKLCEKYFPLETFIESGITPVLASTNIEYRRPISLFDRPSILMWVSAVGRASMTMEAEIYVEGLLTTAAKHVVVFVDLKTMKPVRMPPQCVQAFEAADGK